MRFVALALVAACSNLQPVTPECGNGIIEPGEDCDSGPECLQCSIRCTVGSDGQHSQDCPDQVTYTCGADQLCHAPGGRFHDPTGGFSFAALGFGVTDINADGFGDVVSLSGSSMTVDFGDPTGELASTTSILVPFLTGPPAVTHLDPDLTLDIVMPTFDGLVAYTSPHKVAAPYPFPIPIPQMLGMSAVMTFPLDHQYLGLVIAAGSSLVVAVIDGNLKPPATGLIAMMPVCSGFDASAFAAQRSDIYETGTTLAPSYVATFGAASAAPLCAVQLVANASPSGYTITTIVPVSPAITIQTAPVLARLDATGCPSVIDSDGSGAAKVYRASGSPGACGLDGTATQISLHPGTIVVGHVPLVPVLAGQAPDALAASDGLYSISTSNGAATQMFQSSRPIETIRSLDIDGDGDVDAVASAGQNLDDLDVFYRYGTGTVADPAGFLPFDVDTVGAPEHLAVGDFDGDGIGDLTYTEKLENGERLMIVFGGHDQVTSPSQVSTYSNVLSTSTIGLADSNDPTGTRVRDLIVVDEASGAMIRTVLFGSPQRTMEPFFDPREPGPGSSAGFRGAVSGNFGQGAGGYRDLVAIESFTPTMVPGARLWVIEPGAAGVTVTSSTTRTELGDCGGPAPSFCLDGSNFLAWHAAAGDPDLVVGIERSAGMGADHRIIGIDPQSSAPVAPISLTDLIALDRTLVMRQTYLADLDGDGIDDLVIGFGPAPAAPADDDAGTIATCTFAGTTPTCTALAVPDLAGWGCYDAAPANMVEHQRLDPLPAQPSVDLAVLCHRTLGPGTLETELFRVFHDADGFHAEPRLALPPTIQFVQLADVTGDGVEDVLAVDADASNAVPVLRVYVQCTSRDVDTCVAPGVP